MAILITGGAGFIGSHLVYRLLEAGEAVVVLDNFNDYYNPQTKRANLAQAASHPGFTLVEGDIRRPDDVARAFAAADISAVAHLAAMSGVRNSVSQVGIYIDTNTVGSLNLLEAARAAGVGQFVMASTSSVYGTTPVLPFIETDTADRPLTAYAASKRSAELLAHTFWHLHRMNVTVLRFFNVYGPAGRPDMMPLRLFRAAITGDEVTLFNGGDIARDWTYIDDTVNGVVAALRQPLGYEIINLGVGSPIRMLDFVRIIESLTGRTIRARSVPTPLSDPPITYCNNEKARRLLGFSPLVDVQTGLMRTWEWLREQPGMS
jgi:UDP-glucuronate 4-epimerase